MTRRDTIHAVTLSPAPCFIVVCDMTLWARWAIVENSKAKHFTEFERKCEWYAKRNPRLSHCERMRDVMEPNSCRNEYAVFMLTFRRNGSSLKRTIFGYSWMTQAYTICDLITPQLLDSTATARWKFDASIYSFAQIFIHGARYTRSVAPPSQ